MPHSSYTPADFDISPLMFYYEVTQACDLVCKHCRASAQEEPHQDELTGEQSRALLDQIATFPRKPTVVFTGGDPLKRADLFDLIRYGCKAGLRIAITPSVSPLLTQDSLQKAKDAGVRHLGVSLDGVDASTHDSFRGWDGSFERTQWLLSDARRLEMSVQINTTLSRRNVHQIDDMAAMLSTRGIAMWSIFFLISVGRGVEEECITPEEYEKVFARLWHHAARQPYSIKTTEAPQYRRFVLQRSGDPLAGPPGDPHAARRRHGRAPLGVRDGRGIMFVGHTGEIYPAGFLPMECGRFPTDSVVDVYQKHSTFRELRDSDGLGGDCGICEYRYVCGGSRSRAYAATGDHLAADPDCLYTPGQIPTIHIS